MTTASPNPVAPLRSADRDEVSTRPGAVRRLRDVWAYRELLGTLVHKELKVKYKNSALGFVWSLLNPMLYLVVFWIVFTKFLSSSITYFPIFLLSGLLPYNLFSAGLGGGTTSIVGNGSLVTKVWFPRAVLPASTVPAALLDFGVAIVVLLVISLAGWGGTGGDSPGGALPGAGLLLAPLWALALVLLALGLGLIGAALMVSYRDVQHILPVAIQLLLYASPVAYSASYVPFEYQALYHLNPVAVFLEGLRASLLGTAMPEARQVVTAVITAIVCLVLGSVVFRRLERRFADVI